MVKVSQEDGDGEFNVISVATCMCTVGRMGERVIPRFLGVATQCTMN